MKKKEKRTLFWRMGWILVFVIWTALIQTADVQPVGQNGTDIGFATFNSWFHSLTGVHMTTYIITDWLGLIPVFVCMIFGGMGLTQLVKRRSLLKVDYDILVLGFYYAAVAFGYLIFEMIPINYRPILIQGRMEVSYPSSTTLLVLSVMPTFSEQMNRRLKNAAVKIVFDMFVICFSVFMVMGRLFSGVHWFTDIAGGVLLSRGLFSIYKAILLSGSSRNHSLEGRQWNFMKNFRN